MKNFRYSNGSVNFEDARVNYSTDQVITTPFIHGDRPHYYAIFQAFD